MQDFINYNGESKLQGIASQTYLIEEFTKQIKH